MVLCLVSKEQFEEFNAKNIIETCLDLEEKKFVKGLTDTGKGLVEKWLKI